MSEKDSEGDYAWIRARQARLRELDPSLSSEDALAQACEERAEYKRSLRHKTRPSKPLGVTLGDIIKAKKGLS